MEAAKETVDSDAKTEDHRSKSSTINLAEHAEKLEGLFDDPGLIRPKVTAHEAMQRLADDHERKRLFVCCDGTWNNASGASAPLTNVAKLARAVSRYGRDAFQLPENLLAESELPRENQRYGVVRQIVYYSSGVGTQSSLAVDSLFSGAFGKGIDANILNAYCFICNNYNGRSRLDEIILVGFSRGAFAVRCLARFINDVGLLRRKGLVFLHSIYNSWQRAKENKKGAELELNTKLDSLRALRTEGAKIHVLAEWDCVSAVRSLRPWKKKLSFPVDQVPENVKHAFHAVSLHEKRRSFKPVLWKTKTDTTLSAEQCAFVGCHSDIGGGHTDPGLSTLSLFWMISRIKSVSEAGFDTEGLRPFITPLKSTKFVDKLSPWSWKAPVMCLNNLAITKGRVNESRKGLWLLPYYLSFGLLDGSRDVFLDEFAQARRRRTDAEGIHTAQFDLHSLPSQKKLDKAMAKYLKREEAFRGKALRDALEQSGLREEAGQDELKLLNGFMLHQRQSNCDLPPHKVEKLWLEQQRLRGLRLEQQMGESIGLHIHFTARLLRPRLPSDSRLQCGLFKHFESSARTQEWYKKSSDSLSLAESSVYKAEKQMLDGWIRFAYAVSDRERTDGAFLDLQEIDWSRIQEDLATAGWGEFVAGCTHSESLASVVQEEWRRLRVYSTEIANG
ncbi:hypothetical protein ISF_05738 [Cordyceps fumosorosea ARSEF 2679]|uniref:T6SS Phospholipase effector Tle1-like catalytic domain-containing protein n=1 Tax=Cordyceps fumosorosea (strain ARSEF 2679) TaxID=1081104 RepID=A0A167TKN5_CORFA|nr:hypothetical protein ISF_05738 [Cordyceps fumosorosea ARSEF 2679]OAA60699.1 hypothetical protein ISF_05738 [Cordyceps fumosorosea ARSEF 2679]